MSGYQIQLQEAKASYDMLETFDIDKAIRNLDSAIYTYSQSQTEGNRVLVESAFTPISDYYSKLTEINTGLQDFLEKASKDIGSVSAEEERYNNRVHPEESTKSREVMVGILPDLRIESIPYLLAAAVFMASLTIFMIFQMGGISGQLNLPPALITWWVTPSVGPPIYQNPMVLGGLAILMTVGVIVFAVLYYRKQ